MHRRALLLFAFVLLAPAARAEPLSLWHIEHGDAEVYLLGSIHVSNASIYPLPEPVENAFRAADTVVLEVDMRNVSEGEVQRLLGDYGVYPGPESVRSNISPSTLDLLLAHLDKRGVPFDQVKHMRPWFLSVNLVIAEMQRLGYSNTYGIDEHFLRKADEADKDVRQLETFSEQIRMLASDPPDLQELSLKAALEEMDSLESQIAALMSAWETGDVDAMYALSMGSTRRYPELERQMERLLDERNVRMVEKIEGYLQEDGVFLVIVGALHMGGERGLVALLRRDFEVTQISR